MCKQMKWSTQEHEFCTEMRVLLLGDLAATVHKGYTVGGLTG